MLCFMVTTFRNIKELGYEKSLNVYNVRSSGY